VVPTVGEYENDMRRDELKRKVCGFMLRDRIAAVGCSSMWAGTMGVNRYRRRGSGCHSRSNGASARCLGPQNNLGGYDALTI